MMGKRALNPFTDSVGKRIVHSPINFNFPGPHLGMFRHPHAKSPKSGQLEMLPVDAAKRQYFDSLAGQSLGAAHRYFDALDIAKALDRRSRPSSRVSSLVWLPD